MRGSRDEAPGIADTVPEPISYREGGALDLDQVQGLLDQTPWARGRSKDGLSRMLASTDFVFTAWDGPRLVGFARVLTDQVYRATVWDVVVDAPYQGRGVGEGLMEHVLAHPVLSRVEKFWLNTRDKHAFYERFGFVSSPQGMVLARPRADGSSS
jgi:GNAT superfamily N-acetyltransferase